MRLCAALGLLVAGPVYASHPLISEDTDVLGKGTWQMQLHGGRARDREDGITTRTREVSIEIAHGLNDKLDLEIDLPYLREAAGGTVMRGRGLQKGLSDPAEDRALRAGLRFRW